MIDRAQCSCHSGGCISLSPLNNTRLPSVAAQCCAGITLSKEQVRRGTELAREQGVSNVHFQVTCWGCAHAARASLKMLCLTH